MDQNSPPPPPPPPKSAIPRRGPPLAALRTDIAQQQHQQPQLQAQSQPQQRTRPVLQKPRVQRLRPPEAVANEPQSVPQQPEPTKRVASKTSLRGLFARNKALREERKTENSLPAVGERRGSTTPSTTVPDTPRSVAHTIASGSTLHASSQVATPTESTFNVETPNKSTRVRPELKSKVSSSWTPPPLFQAYPQASKHARLAVPNISPDSILRIHATQAANLRNPSQQGEAEGADADTTKKNGKAARDKKPVRRAGSTTLDQIVFLKKIFVLVTTGYLLQYSGEGNYDRLPEKIMRLGPTSAAFASDSIPGKHHVLQISQKSTDDGAPAAATSGRTFLSRFGLQTAESRRAVRTFLVVMSSAQEMNSWLVALRKTIESLGGKKHVPETAPGDDSEASDVPSNTLLAHRGSRLLASRKSTLIESNPPSPSSDTFQGQSPAASKRDSYQEGDQQQQPRVPSLVKATNRLSISSPLDIVTIPTGFGDSDIIFENPRDAPQPTQGSRTTPTSPPSVPPAETLVQTPATTPGRLRKHSTPTTASMNRRSLTSYTATQLERQGEIARASRPLSFVGSANTSAPKGTSAAPQHPSIPGPNVRLSLLHGESSRSALSHDATSRKTATTEPTSKAADKASEQGPAGVKEDSIPSTQKRHSLISGRITTTTSSSAIATARTIPTIPRKYSLTKTESSEPATPASTTRRYYQQHKLPDINHTPRLPQQQRSSQLTQSRLPSVTERGRPLPRLPKISGESSETTTVPSSNLAQSALSKDRATKASATAAKDRIQLPHRSTHPPTSEDPSSLQSKASTPTSSPRTPQTPREDSSRRNSYIMPQPQSQQTSPRATTRRNPNLSFLPPAPPPNVPLPAVPTPNIAFRHIPLWQRRHLQQPSTQPPQSQLPQPPPLQRQPQQQKHLPRPSISTSSLASSSPPTAATANQQHSRRRSSELRSLHLQMANMLNDSIMHRKQSDISATGAPTTTADATPTSEFPPPYNDPSLAFKGDVIITVITGT
ncbi:peptidase family M20/M25/M40 protein [Talaromyces stipitatus ATCC 10500]|uniref:Peptidase family M20/M25/M40 protein n=1 Tax=Talaromyces stipitatus (strain ATCC 10500 / CBS 375.48 / QM 6759 / NRRL 1006) TaxID=441959 RepID=B8ML27_TALSN|nr:peptidase family M20/M25/M40 protein [Talaromyces stipitatus ATCC 10500]EED15443.1 peptidase family M20/M25/M40 protein [Talaromyces stipitatus ATCC 10500]